MPLMDMIKDPETGKIKPAVLIGGAGIGIAGVYLLMTKGSAAPNSGVTSPGRSGDNTDALNALQAAIQQLAAGGAGGGGTGSIPPVTTNPPGTIITTLPSRITDPHTTTGRLYTVSKLGANTGSSTVPTGVPSRISAISKPSNSGLSPAPTTTSSRIG